MASQRDIRRRIGSVKNIKQITRAMQFVAASKLKRAQDATLAARPYSEKLDEVLADLAAVLGSEDHPLLSTPTGGKRLIVLITTDRRKAARFVQWCDAFNFPIVTFVDTPGFEPGRESTNQPGSGDGRDARFYPGPQLFFADARFCEPMLSTETGATATVVTM